MSALAYGSTIGKLPSRGPNCRAMAADAFECAEVSVEGLPALDEAGVTRRENVFGRGLCGLIWPRALATAAACSSQIGRRRAVEQRIAGAVFECPVELRATNSRSVRWRRSPA